MNEENSGDENFGSGQEKDSKTSPCARCGDSVPDLLKIETGLKLRLKETGFREDLPDQVCPKCFKEVSGAVSQGAKLIAQASARQQNRKIMWKNRVNLLKQAREAMERRAYSEAALLYEKYIRVLEIVQDLPAGQLSPDVFREKGLAKEITVVTSALWDLFRIYDTSPKYVERQRAVSQKLLSFLPYSRIQFEILRQADNFVKTAKNRDVVKQFTKKANIGQARCFVATATFESPDALEVRMLREFRDKILIQSDLGQAFIKAYYRHSPPVAEFIAKSRSSRSALRPAIRLIALFLSKIFSLKTR